MAARIDHAWIDEQRQAARESRRAQWAATTRPADPDRSVWVKLWTDEGEPCFAWWGTDEAGEPVREIKTVSGPLVGTAEEAARCEAIEAARHAFTGPAVAAQVCNELDSAWTSQPAERMSSSARRVGNEFDDDADPVGLDVPAG